MCCSLTDVRTVCRSQCNLCRASPSRAGDPLAFTRPATAATEHGAWKFIEVSTGLSIPVCKPVRPSSTKRPPASALGSVRTAQGG